MTTISKRGVVRAAAAVLTSLLLSGAQGDALINGLDDAEHTAVAAIMIYEPGHPTRPGWRPTCGGALIHKRVVQTAGHCIQFTRARVQAGLVQAVWVSFQQEPLAHFNADPAFHDPGGSGWYEIESLHDNPDNIDFIALRQADPETVRSVWGTFHDSGALILKKRVNGIKPMNMAGRHGAVDTLIGKAGCDDGNPDCDLLVVSYGLREFPDVNLLPIVRHAATLRYRGIDSLFVSTFDDPPGAATGAVCPGDSGAPVLLAGKDGKGKTIVAINSSPADPFGFPCTSGAIHYRVDTESHVAFINGVILESLRGGRDGD